MTLILIHEHSTSEVKSRRILEVGKFSRLDFNLCWWGIWQEEILEVSTEQIVA